MEKEILLLGDARLYQVCEPVRREELVVTAPVPAGDNLWRYFEELQATD